jgi:hypothetical protein
MLDRIKPPAIVRDLTPKEVGEWAMRRYRAAWSNIQGLHLKASVRRLAASVERLDLRHVSRRDELFGG